MAAGGMSEPIRVDDTAVCRRPEHAPDTWFPAHNQESQRAKTLCNGDARHFPCPFLTPCLEYALHHRVDGIWGGTDPAERRKIRAVRGINAKPMPTVRDNRWTARQMASRGVSVIDIAARLEISEQAVRQLLKATS
jgi:hypothetical protein